MLWAPLLSGRLGFSIPEGGGVEGQGARAHIYMWSLSREDPEPYFYHHSEGAESYALVVTAAAPSNVTLSLCSFSLLPYTQRPESSPLP